MKAGINAEAAEEEAGISAAVARGVVMVITDGKAMRSLTAAIIITRAPTACAAMSIHTEVLEFGAEKRGRTIASADLSGCRRPNLSLTEQS